MQATKEQSTEFGCLVENPDTNEVWHLYFFLLLRMWTINWMFFLKFRLHTTLRSRIPLLASTSTVEFICLHRVSLSSFESPFWSIKNCNCEFSTWLVKTEFTCILPRTGWVGLPYMERIGREHVWGPNPNSRSGSALLPAVETGTPACQFNPLAAMTSPN